MKKVILTIVSFFILSVNLHSQYADIGTGALKDKIWWFDWNGFSMSNGASRTFTTTDGLTITITFANVQGPICQPSIMNTWSGAVLHLLYDFSNPAIKPAFYSPNSSQNCAFILNVTATRNGLPVPFKFVAADAEGSGFGENTTLVTSGGNWSCIDFFRNSTQTSNPFLGCNTTSATFQDTYGMAAGVGQNPVIATDAPNSGTLSVNCVFSWPQVPGLTGIAFGIFAPIDRGDLPASYGYAQHQLTFTGLNECNYLPPLPSLIPSQTLKLGASPGDADAMESLNDNAAGADEDGVVSFPLYTGNGTYSLIVNLANTTGSNAYLTGWFDYNRNGVFENNERVTNTLTNNATSSVMTWNGLPAVLPGVSLTPCAFRFRLSSDMALTQSATGFAPDGEIEDYLADIVVNTTIAGVVNDYTEVFAFDPCNNKLTVANASAYNVGDTVLLIQMKGAVIDTTNTAAFGSITDYKNAGNYEFNYIKSKTGNIIELKNFLTRQYDIPDGVVQLIRVPYYTDAEIASTVTCLPWDGGKGGVVVVNVQNTLTMNAPIHANYKGFRGGIDPVSNQSLMNCNENQFYYPNNPDLASGKGEGIASISSNKSFGKGALANGGGGGNSHNSGGGGGSNGSAGGFGGYQLESCGNASFDNRGIGGNALPYNNAVNKIFMGGGGGAGHSNNPEGFQATGGTGGGIIIISANTLLIMNPNSSLHALGMTAPECPGLDASGCHEGTGGGGAGGTILFNVNSYSGDLAWNTKGGQGAQIFTTGLGRLGPGGGGSGGVTWYKSSSIPANVTGQANAGGVNGVNTEYTNDSWGATSGQQGFQLFNLALPVSGIPFKPNIDSVRIKDSIIGCSGFYFKGFGYTNTNPVVNWQWYFGDGTTANTQNTSHSYASLGNFTVKLVITDINGCQDSIATNITATALSPDFNYQVNTCDPLTVQFNAIGSVSQNQYWSFGDAATVSGVSIPVHTYSSENSYVVKYAASNGTCTDTVTKTISLSVIPDDIVVTRDTTICFGTTKQLLTKPALSFCWSPATYLNDPNSPNPVTSTSHNLTYYYTAEVTGNNLVLNSDFSQGNTGFTSSYVYNPTSGVNAGVYSVGSNILAWHPTMTPCNDHTTGPGDMMMVNGDDQPGSIVWSETITVQPNTNYAFSAWLQHITIINPASLQFSINGRGIGNIFQANNTSCIWDRFYTVWNSGNKTTAVISIINQNLLGWGNDFALDDISFAPVFIKRDSVRITVDNPIVKTSDNTPICPGTSVQLNTSGAMTYSWSPSTGLSDPAIANPVASPVSTTEYFVTGTSANGCTAKDTVSIIIYPKSVIAKTRDTTVCKNSSFQLFASGGINYVWSPATTLNDPNISNPVASPTEYTTYYILVTDANTCTYSDSVKLSIRPDPVFTISLPETVCVNSPAQLMAGGGNVYFWQPATSLNNAAISNPVATPAVTINYSVNVTETTCNNSTTLFTTVVVNQLPPVKANKSTDIDCSNDHSQLNAAGAQKYAWSPVFSLDNPLVSNPVATPASSTLYIVKGTDASGCSNYDSIMVNVLSTNASGYNMPNAFTPNNDGANDCYGIRFWGVIQQLEFSIYNRWGERIFFTTNPNACWNGIYKGVMQQSGVYVYMIKAKTLCGETFKKGFFTLIR